MWTLLVACVAAPSESDSAVDADSAADTADTADAGDTGDTGPVVEPGPTCTDTPLPVATPFNVLAAHAVTGTLSAAELDDLRTLAEAWAPDQPGPWAHAVVGPRRSADGLSFEAAGAEFAAASVPDVVRTEAGWFMVYVSGDLAALLAAAEAGTPLPTGMIGFGGLAAATSTDGEVWTPVGLQVEAALPAYAVDPELRERPGGGWFLYFLGVPAGELCRDAPDPFLVPGPHRLFRAESEDLVHWSEAVEVWQNPGGGTDPAVWCATDLDCRGWFSAPMRSADGGASWAADTGFSMPLRPEVPDVLAVGEGELRMYYGGSTGIAVAASSDGAEWRLAGNTGLGFGSPTAVLDAGEVWLWVSGPVSE